MHLNEIQFYNKSEDNDNEELKDIFIDAEKGPDKPPDKLPDKSSDKPSLNDNSLIDLIIHSETDEEEQVKTFVRLFKKSKHLGYGLPDL